jgi:hypothetical protein
MVWGKRKTAYHCRAWVHAWVSCAYGNYYDKADGEYVVEISKGEAEV